MDSAAHRGNHSHPCERVGERRGPRYYRCERGHHEREISASDIGAVIVATISNDVSTPSMAALVADRIGATPAAAYDVSAACAGFCYGIAQADALVRAGAAKYVLVIGAEKLSDYAEPTDRTISFLLGDGAGAVICRSGRQRGDLADHLGL